MDKIMRMINGNKKFEENKEIKNFIIIINLFIVLLILMLFFEFHLLILIFTLGLGVINLLLSHKYKRNKLYIKFLGCYCCSYFSLKDEKCVYTGALLEGNFNICYKFFFNQNLNDLITNLKTLEAKYKVNPKSCPKCNSKSIQSKYKDEKFTDGRLDLLQYYHCNNCNYNWRIENGKSN